MRHRVVGTFAALLVLVAVTGGAVVATRGQAAERDPLGAAVDALPGIALTADVTVWSRIRGGLDDASLRDVTTRSTIAVLAGEMRERLGWDPTDLDWESFTTFGDGGVTVVSLGRVSNREVRSSFRDLTGGRGDVWDIGSADVSSDFAVTFQRARLLPERRMLVLGSPGAVAEAVDTIEGRGGSLLDQRPVADLVRSLGDVASVSLQERAVACQDDGLGDDERAALVRAAGAPLVDPLWSARALLDDTPQRLVSALAFASPQQARDQLAARVPLTSGEFVGRGGRVEDSLRDLRAAADGAVTVLDLELTPEAELFMAGTGPVVFSGCAVPSPA